LSLLLAIGFRDNRPSKAWYLADFVMRGQRLDFVGNQVPSFDSFQNTSQNSDFQIDSFIGHSCALSLGNVASDRICGTAGQRSLTEILAQFVRQEQMRPIPNSAATGADDSLKPGRRIFFGCEPRLCEERKARGLVND